jgi:cob(I)alamin adenosyltransferase
MQKKTYKEKFLKPLEQPLKKTSRKMISISTKTGDAGTSGLANGERVGKNNPIFDVLGTQDELNAWLGLCIAKLSDHFTEQKTFLLQVQDTLFYVGAEIARSPKAKVSEKVLSDFEKTSEELQTRMQANWTTKFLYPGGNEAAATIDVARTISRRLEREVVKYSTIEKVSPIILKYLNRLSDYLFILRCYVNQEEKYTERAFEVSK